MATAISDAIDQIENNINDAYNVLTGTYGVDTDQLPSTNSRSKNLAAAISTIQVLKWQDIYNSNGSYPLALYGAGSTIYYDSKGILYNESANAFIHDDAHITMEEQSLQLGVQGQSGYISFTANTVSVDATNFTWNWATVLTSDTGVSLTGSQTISGDKTFTGLVTAGNLAVTGTITSGTWNGNTIASNYLPTANTTTLGVVKTTDTSTSTSGYKACRIVNGNVYSKDPIGSITAGSSNKPAYIQAGVPKAVSSVGEAFLSWGGTNLKGTYSPIDAAMVPSLGSNKLAIFENNATCVEIQYSRDGGTTWFNSVDTSIEDKVNLFNGIGSEFIIGNATSDSPATNQYLLKVIITNTYGRIYTDLNKFIMNISTNGSNGCYCTIKARTQYNKENNIDTWETFAENVSISGWSGYNVINTNKITTYGNLNRASTQYGEIAFIFGATEGTASGNVGLKVLGIQGFGGAGHSTPSNLAKYGNMYSYDAYQNIITPNGIHPEKTTSTLGTTSKVWDKVYANSFVGSADKVDGKHVRVMSELAYNVLTTKDPNTIYFIIQDSIDLLPEVSQ